MSNWRDMHPDLPEPKATGNRGSMTDVEIKSNGAVLKFSFDSWEEAQAFIDAYANAYAVIDSWEGPIHGVVAMKRK